MIYYRLLITAIIVLAALYYIMVVLHCFKVIKLTEKDITFLKCVIPFYYWIKG